MRSWQGLVAIAGGVGLILGLAWGGLLRDGGPRALPAGSSELAQGGGGRGGAGPADEIAALTAELAEERLARQALAEEVQQLREELEQLALIPPAHPKPPEKVDASPHPPQARLYFDEPALLAEGIPADVAAGLRERFDESRMEELYLRDQATREGWIHTPRYREELGDLRVGLREEIGDEDYDRLLYATRQNNRVIVQEVLQGSPAMEAGLRAGDVVYSYDRRRIFDRSELLAATTEGKAGATVAIEVLRNGELQPVYLPRGPIGIVMKPGRDAPRAGW